jgi:hypothetical protein
MKTHISNLISGDLNDAQIAELCKYHNDPNKTQIYEAINEATKAYLSLVVKLVPRSAQRTIAIQNMLLVRMQLNAAVALPMVEVPDQPATPR